jgi:protein-glutamine gamma-glutamyltransferase
MKDIPFLTSAALIYWGYNSDHLVLSIIFSVILESYRYVKFRLDFSRKDFDYISMLSTVSTAGYLIFYINSGREIGVISSILQFMPILLFPLIFFYLYGTSTYVNAKRLFLLFVTNRYSIVHPYIKFFRPDFLYFAAVLLGGSIKAGSASFFIVFILILPVLYKFRSKNHSVFRFILSAAGVLILSLLFQTGIYNSFFLLRDFLTDLYIERVMKDIDKSMPVGNIGSLKDNFIIQLRAESYTKHNHVIYLRDRVYNTYFNGRWSETGTSALPSSNKLINYGSVPLDSLRIYFFSGGKTDDLKMPFGTYDFAGIDINKSRYTSLGNVSSDYSQYLIDYKTYSRTDTLIHLFSDPEPADIKVISGDTITADLIIDSLDLKALPAKDVFFKLRNHFISRYKYSLDYADWKEKDKISEFIRTKEGHCEMFATLSCLVFRRLGYPSRYVTGYLLTEYSGLEDKFIGRKKDRHAWLYVWDNKGSWLELDTTPPDISNFRQNSIFSRIYDYFSFIYYEAFLLKKDNNELFRKILFYSLIPLGLFLLFRILKDVKKIRNDNPAQIRNPYKEISELKIIDEKLKNAGHSPGNETLGVWFDRIKNGSPNGIFTSVKNYYYKIRYGNFAPEEKEKYDFENSLKKINQD